jgi:GLPGLI family protein
MFGDFSKIDSINKNFKEMDKNIALNFNNIVQYKLIHNKHNSIFKSYDTSQIFTSTDENSDLAFLNNYKLNDFSSVVFKDFKSKITMQREFIIDKPFIISDSLTNYNWILHDDVKLVAGLKCASATTTDHFGKTVKAWFTISIPFSNGPGDFHGLPGLIVSLESDEYIYEMSKFKIIKDAVNLNFTEKGKIVTMNEFIKTFNEKMSKYR